MSASYANVCQTVSDFFLSFSEGSIIKVYFLHKVATLQASLDELKINQSEVKTHWDLGGGGHVQWDKQ